MSSTQQQAAQPTLEQTQKKNARSQRILLCRHSKQQISAAGSFSVQVHSEHLAFIGADRCRKQGVRLKGDKFY